AEVVASSGDTPELSVEAPVDLDADDGAKPAAVDELDREIAADSSDVAETTDDVADDVESFEFEPFADDVELVPLGEAAEMPETETPSELDDLFIEDTPPPQARFSARRPRKGEQGEKTPKRKSARGGGAKGRHVVGLKIGASQIAAAVVVESNGKHELVDLARRPLAAGIVVDGEVKDIDALSNALKAFFDEEKLPKKDVRIGLASNRIGVRTFDIIGIDDETRFDNAVRFRAHEVLPVAAHESVLDYRVLEERPNAAGEPTRRVLLVVAPNDQVEPYAEVARRVGIKLSGIDLEALGLLRAFVEPKPFAVRAADDTATVVVSIGHESSTLLVAGGGTCEFTRVFDWGGSALVEAITSTLEVHPAEAATILKHLSLSGPGRQFDGLDDLSRTRALDAVRLRLAPFARELVSSLQFYQTQDESLGIGGVVITGGTSHLEGLGEALNQMIGVNVSVGDPLGRVTTSIEIGADIEAIIGSMAVPIGLAIDDIAMRSVDLLPKDAVKTRSTRSTMIAVGAPIAAAVPLIALGAMYLGAHGKAADSRAELAAVKAEIAALPTPTGPDIDASVVGDEAARATAIASVLGGRLAWDSVFRDMARVFPTNVWLKSLSASLPEDANLADGTTAAAAAAAPGGGQPAPTAVVIEGYTYTQPDVARLLARLATLPSLKRVTLTSSQRETVGKKEVVRFVIVADLSSTGGAS
ncbi:MAG: type IV pilus assembly protein PilM, partial [Thermoleophilia bacterium]|nr:type IV pilus assembly protein PilM [Thermoleophilia bacterium]